MQTAQSKVQAIRKQKEAIQKILTQSGKPEAPKAVFSKQQCQL
jgi:hypothetical protein